MSRAGIAVAIAVAAAGPAGAGGPLAHRAVGRVAVARLTPAALRAVHAILRDDPLGDGLADVGGWADDVRDDRPETKRWHFVDVPRDARGYDARRDCRRRATGDCVVAAIARSRAALRTATGSARAEALKFLVHFVADAHQPLHCTDDGDRGGNDVHVLLLGRPQNFHAVWDGGLFSSMKRSERALAARLETLAGTSGVDDAGTVVDWVDETHAVGVREAYGTLPRDGVLDRAWVTARLPAAERQLARAAVRLARVLNETLSP